MSALSSIGIIFQAYSPVGFIRRRLDRFGAFIKWLGQRLVGKSSAEQVPQTRAERFALLEILAKQNSGQMSEDEHQKLAGFFNEVTGPQGATLEGHKQFVLDAVRTATGRSHITFEGRKFFTEEPRFRRAFEEHQRGDSPGLITEFFANYLIEKSGQECANSARWLGIVKGIINQSSNIYTTRLTELITQLAELGISVGTTQGSPTFPREIDIRLQRDTTGVVIGVNIDLTIGYRVNDPSCGALGHFEVKSEMFIDFDPQDRVRVSMGEIKMEAIADNELSLKEIKNLQTYDATGSVGNLIFWGADTISRGYLGERSTSPHLEQMQSYIHHRGVEKACSIRENLGYMRGLYKKTGQEQYNRAAQAQVRALFEEEIVHLDFRDVENNLLKSFEKQFADRTQSGDLRMYVGDNKTRSIMKTNVIFEADGKRPQARYDSESPFYATGAVGAERPYFTAMQEQLKERYTGPSQARDMLQALMTQSVLLDFTADLFEKTALDGYSLPGDIEGAAAASIVVHSDERITFAFETRYKLLGIDRQSAGEIAVDAAVDLRFENGAWRPRIVKRDISVIHE